ncbi:hypothetical protein E2C01_045481 [Portunus trituberculatus]|uniref:Uncharacterized protein n=1 Tax=Portunus trituberculatus TaxID=210409 RepID=A0A5B7FVX2_PORTR|nr:hypothetical protein [Portunus trituberculatus]
MESSQSTLFTTRSMARVTVRSWIQETLTTSEQPPAAKWHP